MNEYTSRRLIAQAVGAPNGALIGTEKKVWTTVLTALNGGVFSSANNEHEFWRKFADLLGDELAPLPATQTVVSNGQAVTIGGSTYTFTVAGGAITNIVVS